MIKDKVLCGQISRLSLLVISLWKLQIHLPYGQFGRLLPHETWHGLV